MIKQDTFALDFCIIFVNDDNNDSNTNNDNDNSIRFT